ALALWREEPTYERLAFAGALWSLDQLAILLLGLGERLQPGGVEGVKHQPVHAGEVSGKDLRQRHQHAVAAKSAAAPEPGVNEGPRMVPAGGERLQPRRAKAGVGGGKDAFDLVVAVRASAARGRGHGDEVGDRRR